MTRSLRRATPLLGVLAPALVASVAQAQAKTAQGPTCDVDQNKPASLATALFTITRVQSQADTAAKQKALREAVGKVLGDAKAMKENPLGTALTVGQAWSILAQDVRLANGATRGTVGLPGDAAAPVDLLKLVDSTMTVVTAAKPACAETADQLRQFAWLNTMNGALTALNAQKVDSAATLAQRSLVVYTKSPLPYYVLSVAAQQKGDMKAAAGYWPKIVAATEGDTTQTARDLRANAMYNMAVTMSQEVDDLKGDAQKTRAREAAAAMRTFLTAYPTHQDASRMQASLARMLTVAGDTGALEAIYSDMIANPAKHGDLAITNAGVTAAQAGQHAMAGRLFEAALKANPHQRDALNNLASTNIQLKRWQETLEPAQKLLALDPGNPDNYIFIAAAYQGLMNAAKVPAQKKAYTDSLLKYNRLGTEMTTKVSFTEFTRGEAKSTVGLTVENLAQKAATPARAGAAARPAAAAAKTVTLQFEFLDKSGNVVDTQAVTVGPVAPGATKTAQIDVAKPGVVAYRYKIQS